MIRAALFDMDGVLLDTETLGLQAMVGIAADLGYTIDRTFTRLRLAYPTRNASAFIWTRWGRRSPMRLRWNVSAPFFRNTTAPIRCRVSRG